MEELFTLDQEVAMKVAEEEANSLEVQAYSVKEAASEVVIEVVETPKVDTEVVAMANSEEDIVAAEMLKEDTEEETLRVATEVETQRVATEVETLKAATEVETLRVVIIVEKSQKVVTEADLMPKADTEVGNTTPREAIEAVVMSN